ncbi:MAG: ferritin [Prevotellaceae bacterium]|nr:ferritin [Prevotellaceae bacterium]
MDRTALKPAMEAALNVQANAELWSAYLYLSMSYDMRSKGYDGIACWYAAQAKEEQTHAEKLLSYLSSRGGRVSLQPIEAVPQDWASPAAAFADTAKHENLVTNRIYELVDMAVELKDYATQIFLQWYVSEQVEEENTARKYADALQKIGSHEAALIAFDKELGARLG